MKAIHPVLLSLLIAASFSSPAGAGEPNVAVFGNEHSKGKIDKSHTGGNSAAMPSGECPPKSAHEKNAQHTGSQHTDAQHTGVLTE
ncbi:hypothetical protein SAMN05216420_101469 [Nitrosospira sp. Nl5]|nr:hypothetical protein SAMN05216420_101469 [Nitrosospira sp. Nl5]